MRGVAGVARRLVPALVGAMLVAPATASAYKAAPGYQAGDYAVDFPSAKCCGWGPIGLAFDESDNLYVADNADGHVYRFQPGGGQAGPATRLTGEPIPGDIKGLAIASDGGVFLARAAAGDVVQIDPATGAVVRAVAAGIACATGLAVDPISGDLFVSQNACGSTIWRISGFASGAGSAAPYAVNLPAVDGIAFGPDGMLYAVSADHAVQIEGTNGRTPGAARALAPVPHADGLAIGPPTAPGEPPVLVVNSTDGNVTRVDFTKQPPERTPVMSEGSRGDFAAVDSRGCLYVTQSTSIVRISPQRRSCDLAPSTPAPTYSAGAEGNAPALIVDTLTPRDPAAPRRCKTLRKVVLRVRQRGRVKLRVIRAYVGSRRVQTLRNRRVTSRITIRRLPRKNFTVKLVAKTTKGKVLKKKVRYRNC
jgi:sugar lactone lactonase YvrE